MRQEVEKDNLFGANKVNNWGDYTRTMRGQWPHLSKRCVPRVIALCVTVCKKLHNFMVFEIREIKEEEDATFLGELKNGQQQSVYLVNNLHLLF